MTARRDPSRGLRKRLLITQIVGVLAAAACAVWAFTSLSSTTVELAQFAEPDSDTVSPTTPITEIGALDAGAFTAAIWYSPEIEAADLVEANDSASSQRAARLQLVGIIHENGANMAALYDPDLDRLFIVSNGDRIHRHQVIDIGAKSIQLSDGRATVRLNLREGGSS